LSKNQKGIMKKIKARLIGDKACVEIVKATCDICGKTCMKQVLGNGVSFEGIELKAYWGYASNNKDLEKWEAQICEECVDKHLVPLIKFQKSNYYKG